MKAPVSAAALSRAISRGDTGALAEFYESRFHVLLALARSFTGRDESFCLDVIQETMLRIARRMKPMAADADVDRWTASVLRNAARDLLRRDRRRAAREVRTAGPDASTGYAVRAVVVMESTAPLDGLRAALAGLSEDDALLLKLRFQHDATLDQAGRALHTTGAAAHGRLRRTLHKLRAILSEPTP